MEGFVQPVQFVTFEKGHDVISKMHRGICFCAIQIGFVFGVIKEIIVVKMPQMCIIIKALTTKGNIKMASSKTYCEDSFIWYVCPAEKKENTERCLKRWKG